MTPNKTVQRIPWLDTAKGIGLLCVIFGHLQVPYLSTWIYTFHMPLFFFLSGIVFSGEKYRFREFLLRKIKTLVIPYFVLGSGILLFYCADFARRGLPASAYLEMLKQFLLQEHYWTIWFLACLFVTEIMYYLLYTLLHRSPAALSLCSLLLCILGLLRYRLGKSSLPWNFDVALIAQFFFHAGYGSRDSLIQFSQTTPKLSFLQKAGIALFLLLINSVFGVLCIRVSGASLDMSVGLYGSEVFTFLSAFAGILLIIFCSTLVQFPFLTYLGRNTMVIFGWHSRIIIVLCNYIYAYFNILQDRQDILSHLLYAGITALIIFAVLLPATELMKRSHFCTLFGLKKS